MTDIPRDALLASSNAHRAAHGDRYDPDACDTCWKYEMALLGVIGTMVGAQPRKKRKRRQNR